MKIPTVLGTILAAGLALAATAAAPVSADLITRCVGTAGAVTVPGDLVVPAGEACQLTGTTVEGMVRIQTGADLVVVDATLNGAVRVAANGFFNATTSSVAGTVTNRGLGVYLDRSTLGEDLHGRGSDTSSFTYLYDSSVAGQVDARAGEVLLDSSTAGGPVRGLGTVFVDVINSTLADTLMVKGNSEGVTICSSEVDGDAVITANIGVQLGSGDLIRGCVGGTNYFGANVKIANNTAGVTVRDNIIRGNLSGSDNDPAPTGSDNRVRGNVTDQFADMQVDARAGARVMATQPDRSLATVAKAEHQRAQAVEQATESGHAKL